MRHRLLVLFLLSIPVAALFGVVATSRLYWGYWFGPPSSDRIARRLDSLHRFTVFWPTQDPACGPDALAAGARDSIHISGESPFGRLEEAIVRRGLSPESSECLPTSLLVEIASALQRSGQWRFRPEVIQAPELYGALAEGASPNGERMILAALTSGPVSDDHYPYYELSLFQSSGGSLQIVESRFYWYDVAGLEGLAHWFGGMVAALGALVFWAIGAVIRVAARLARFAA